MAPFRLFPPRRLPPGGPTAAGPRGGRRAARRRPARPLTLESLEDRTLLSGSAPGQSPLPFAAVLADAQPWPLPPSGVGSQAGTLGPAGAADVYQIVAPATGGLGLREDA